LGGSLDLLDAPSAEHGVEENANWTSFILWLINVGILIIACGVNFIDVFAIMMFGPFFILFSIVNIYRGIKKRSLGSKFVGIGGLLIVSTVVFVINIHELTPSEAQEPISQLTVALAIPYCSLVVIFLNREFKRQKSKRSNSN
jgi:hypothetical protein